MSKNGKYEYYKKEKVEAFMMNILEKNEKVKPVFDLELGYRYLDVEKMIGLKPDKTNGFLDSLVLTDILEKELHDMELRCPLCDTPNVSVNYVCPKCASTNIIKTLLLEHPKCGFLGTIVNFGTPLTCPQCGERLQKNNYRDAGSVYKCAQCDQQIETPFVEHWCRKCGDKFSFENAIYQPKYAYVPTKSTKMEIIQGVIYPSQVTNAFEEQGFTRESSNKVLGESGLEQTFDLAFKGYGLQLYVDIYFSLSPMTEIDLLKNYAKMRDVKATSENVDVFLLVLPELAKDAETLGKTYNLNLVTGKKPNIVLSKLRKALEEKVPMLKALTELEAETEAQEDETQDSLQEKTNKRRGRLSDTLSKR